MQVGVSFRTEAEDVEKLDRIALHIFRQNRAGALRLLLLEAIDKYMPRVMEQEQGISKPFVTAIENQPTTYNKVVVPQQPVVLQANYEATEDWGPPKACPVCDAITSSDGLEQPALAVVKSGSDWGTWACHECLSDGKWHRNRPFTILKNTLATPSQNDNM